MAYARRTQEEAFRSLVAGFRDLDPLLRAQFYNLLVEGLKLNYPYSVDGRPLGLVIQQWATESPSLMVAGMLKGDPLWEEQVRLLHDLESETITLEPQVLFEHVGSPIYDGYAAGKDEESIRRRLRWFGYPDTPEVVTHLRTRSQGKETPNPARGVLVTTRVYMDWPEGGTDWEMDASPDFTITGASEWTAQAIHDRAY